MTDKLPWLALRRIPGVGLVLFHRLVQAFGSPGKVFQAAREDLRSIKGVSPAMAQAIAAFREWGQVEAEISGLRALGAEMLTWEDPAFPPRLKEIPLAPPFIFVQGTLEEGDALAVAMVGTRTPSYYGLKTCRRLAGALAFRGLTVVSGLARGIDTAAHQGALENSGRTLAVLGCGLDVVYPPENRELYQRIPEHGALISEFPLGAPPEARNFPVRNRLISGLSLAVASAWRWWWWKPGSGAAPPLPCPLPWSRAGRSWPCPAPLTRPPVWGRTASSRKGPSWLWGWRTFCRNCRRWRQ